MFSNPEYNELPVVSLGNYHPYKIAGVKNPDFDSYSGKILDVKGLTAVTILEFSKKIHPLIDDDICICYVPSSDSEKTDTGIRRLAIKLAIGLRVDATGCLIRHTSIEKLATGGNRDKQRHLDSIKVCNKSLIRNKRVLLIDDVTTSHNSLFACKQLLLEAGVAEVYCLALGQTV